MSAFDLSPSQSFTFLSPEFWGFMAFVLVGIWASEQKLRVRNAFLFFVSLLFYWKTNGWFVGLLVLSTTIDWGIGWQIHRSEGVRRKQWLAASIIANLGMLCFFKYAYFFADALNPLLGTHWNPHLALGQWANAHLGTTFAWIKSCYLSAFHFTLSKHYPTALMCTGGKLPLVQAYWTSDSL